MQGGAAEFTQALTNDTSGQILGRGTLITGGTGLTNNGFITFSGGITDVFGDVNNATGTSARGITISGNANVTFWDDFTEGAGSLLQVSAGSVATFFKPYMGAGITGGGQTNFEADISPGFSPASVSFGGNVHLDPTANLKIELGGTSLGTQFDHVQVAGQLALDGTLQLVLINGFAPAAGNSFDILDWGSLAGTFSAVQLPTLAGGLAWNASQLYTTGVLSVTSAGVPGDYNNNGIVDAADYVVWRKYQGTTHALANDPIGGTIGAAQYTTWRANFGKPPGADRAPL